MMVSRFPEAGNWFERALAIDANNLSAKSQYPFAILFSNGDVAQALAAAQGNEPGMQQLRVGLLICQRKYAEALALLNAIPDTPDNFILAVGSSKTLQQADLYRLLGDDAEARSLYQRALAELRPQLAKSQQTQNPYFAEVWTSIADAELGLGQTNQGLAAIAKAQAANAKLDSRRPSLHAILTAFSASLYAQAGRAELAVPLLAKALAMPAIGVYYSPVLLWLDPARDPIRHGPRFQALLKKYAKYKPAVTYAAAPGKTNHVAAQ